MKPYIAIDASALCKDNKTGVEWYTWQLLKYLAKEWKKSDTPVVLFLPNKIDNGAFSSNNDWRFKILPGKFFWTQYHLLKFLKRYPPVVLFSPSYAAPRFLPKNIPAINVVHGLEGEYHPEYRPIKKILLDHLFTIPALKNSSKIIAVSKHTEKDLNHFYGIELDRIKTVLSGPGSLDDESQAGIRPKNNKEEIKFLFLGGSSERKNLELAVRIFSKLRDRFAKTQNFAPLQVAGIIKNRKLYEHLANRKEDINLLGYLSEENKIKELRSANFLLYPSFYEGFGFPVLEAQAYGAIPVVLEDSGLDEVGGEGIIQFDPFYEEESLIKIGDCIKDPSHYSQLQKLGRENARKYSWQTCAKETKKILLETINYSSK